MSQFINQNSFLLFAIPVVLVPLYFLLRPPGSRLKQVLALALLASVVAGFFLARPGNRATSSRQVESILVDGDRPAFLEVYSPY